MNKKDILFLQEAERKRIAEELHDTTVQDMVYLSQQLELVMLYMEQDLTLAKLETITARKQIKHIIGGMRDTIYNLRPMIFDDIGWMAAWERLKKKLTEEHPKLEIVLDIDMIDTSDGLTAISIYRIVCEGCQNIVKHSKASHIQLSVKEIGNQINIIIYDNGIGMQEYDDCPSNHFGLQFIVERVKALSGKMKILSDRTGTKISIKIPKKAGD
ncbi:MAG: hypothetical protein K2L86_13540 [Lachnospiraceae bacterium]|nr:hypothetical protein [Lachnospiraceae bacterium]